MIRIAFALTFLYALLAPAAAHAAPRERTSTVWQRKHVSLTVYNGGTALVHDRRSVYLDGGLNLIAWRDVSAQMDPTSALVDPVGGSNRISVLEQNFDFDLLNPDALLQRYVGHEVIVVHDARFTGDRETRERARILSVNGGIVLQYRDRIETQVRGHIIYPNAGSILRDRPTLVLEMQSVQQGSQLLDLSYLTSGLTWRADYVGALSQDEKSLNLTGLVTLSNTSGAAYNNATLQLVAGDVNAPAPAMGSLKTIARMTADTYSVRQFGSENYFEYHLYRLLRPTTIMDKQTKQVSLLTADDVPVRKTLELRGGGYYRQESSDLGDRLPIGVYVTFGNRGGELGIPLPAGIVRIYKNDSHGGSQFIGSDNIPHTPKNETVRLHLGNSFDVTARKIQTDFEGHDCYDDSSYKIVISNAKSAPQDVLVVESIPGTWTILSENLPHVKSSAATATWTVTAPADGRATLTYTARSSWC